MTSKSETNIEVGPPLHGYRGDSAEDISRTRPSRLTVAVSRQVGARGGSIAKRAGEQLGWQVVTHDLLEYMASNEDARSELTEGLPQEAFAWVDARLARLAAKGLPHADADMGELPRLILLLAARGNVILVGRGAGFLLPQETTLHARVIAPEDDRVGYVGQWLRLTEAEAGEELRQRDLRRGEFLLTAFGDLVSEPTSYDLTFNSARLGADVCVELLVNAARAQQRQLVWFCPNSTASSMVSRFGCRPSTYPWSI